MGSLFKIRLTFGRRDLLHDVFSTASKVPYLITAVAAREVSCTSALNNRRPRHNVIKRSISDIDNMVLSVLKRWPFLRVYYDQMTKGFKRQYSDFRTWRSVQKKLNADPGYQKSYQEEKAVFDIKGSLTKTSVLLPLFLLPMGIVIVFIPVALFPQFMLPRCYWNLRQRDKFLQKMNEDRLHQHGIILHHLTYLKNNHKSVEMRLSLEPIMKAANDSKIPGNGDLVQLRDSCRRFDNPLNVSSLPPVLLSALCHINFLWKYLPPQWLAYYLNRRATLILELDEKLRRENLVYDLPEDELQDATFLRGVDCTSLSKEANQYWLKNWTNHTQDCSGKPCGCVSQKLDWYK